MGKRQLTALHMHGAKFSTAIQGRNGLAGIEQGMLIKGLLDGKKQIPLGFFKLYAHLIDFFYPDAMLTRNSPAKRNRQLQYFPAKLLGPETLLLTAAIIQDERVQIAIPGMKHIEAAQPVFILHRSDGIEHLTQALARNRAIHAQIIRGNAPCRRKRRLAPGPKQLTLLLGTGDLDSGRAILAQKRLYPGNLLGHLLGGAI